MTTTHARTVTMPPEYFRRALKDYSDWHFALIREFVQNSADAGASYVNLTFDSGTANGVVTCTDNGRGCNAATIENKLLVLGGSEKPVGAVGGFGLAKELLYFAHPKWAIRTRDVLVEGAFGTYTLTTGHEHVEGFIATVFMADRMDVSSCRYAAGRFSAVFDRPECELRINGYAASPGEAYKRAGRRAAKVFSWGKVYRMKDAPAGNGDVWLRTCGIPTATEYVGALDSSVGTVVVELTGASADILTVSRERLRSHANRMELAGFLRELATDARKALNDHDVDDDPVALFFDADDVNSLLSEQPASADKRPEDMTAADLDALEAELRAPIATSLGTVGTSGSTGGGAFIAMNGADIAALVRNGTAPKRGALAKTPPVVRKSDLPDVGARKLGVRVAPNGVKAAQKYLGKWFAKRDLAVWATACEAVFRAIGKPLDTVGFTFDKDAEAEAVSVSGRFALFVNPAAFERATSANVPEEAIDLAVHEAAHITCPGGHTESWAVEEMRIRRALRGTDIRKLVAKAARTTRVERPE